jgi:hypothetical protein
LTKSLHTTSYIGPDGVLRVTLPAGLTNTDVDVHITLSPVNGKPARKLMDQAEWARFIEETAGKWEGEFVRPPQGDYEQREPWT